MIKNFNYICPRENRSPKILLVLILFSLTACESVLNSSASISVAPVTIGSNPTVAITPFTKQIIEAALMDLPIKGDTSELPPLCNPHTIAQLIITFFDAFNRGDQPTLATLFFESKVPEIQPSEGYSTQWFASGTAIRNFSTQDIYSLLNHFAERHQFHEHLTLLALSIRPSWIKNSADIVFLLTRQADDIKATPTNPKSESHGKGNINCKKQRIRIWSMGMVE